MEDGERKKRRMERERIELRVKTLKDNEREGKWYMKSRGKEDGQER